MSSFRAVIERALIGDEVTVSRVVGGQLRGHRLVLNRATETRKWLGLYEREVQRALAEAPGGFSWDLGAHTGFFTILLARKGRVVAIEPDPDNVRVLEQVVRLNGVEDRVVVRQIAVSGRPGRGHLGAGASSDSSERRLGDEGLEVELTTLDELAAKHGVPDIIKMDIEGAEADALRAAETVLAARPMFVIETHTPTLRLEVQRCLADHGYTTSDAGNSLVARHREA